MNIPIPRTTCHSHCGWNLASEGSKQQCTVGYEDDVTDPGSIVHLILAHNPGSEGTL